MKLTPLLGGAALCALLSTTALAGNIVVGLSFSGDPADAQRDAKELAAFLLEAVDPGEQAVVIDLGDRSEIGAMRVPDNPAYAAPKAKLNANRPFFRALLGRAEAAGADESEASDIAGFLVFAARNHPSSGDDTLIVLAPPVHHDARDAAFSMKGGRVPGDGHTLASRARSPYGARDAGGALAGYRILIGGSGDDWRVNDQHSFYTERFWAQNVAARDGAFIGVVDDRRALFALARNPNAKPLDAPELTPTEKLEMAVFRPTPPASVSTYEREITTERARRDDARHAEHVQIGIRWDCEACDLDLYARPHPSAEVIFFGAMETRAGRLFKDYRQSPSITNGLETIAFHTPVDLSRLELAVNFYGGAAPVQLNGEVRIAIGARTWAQAFSFEARSGNRGKGAARLFSGDGAENANWIVIDPLAVVGLSRGR